MGRRFESCRGRSLTHNLASSLDACSRRKSRDLRPMSRSVKHARLCDVLHTVTGSWSHRGRIGRPRLALPSPLAGPRQAFPRILVAGFAGLEPASSGEGIVSERGARRAASCPWRRVLVGACCQSPLSRKAQRPTRRHCLRDWREQFCPTCNTLSEEPSRTSRGRDACRPHAPRLRLGRNERADAAASEVRGATVATVSFTGRAGEGGRLLAVVLSRLPRCQRVGRYRARD